MPERGREGEIKREKERERRRNVTREAWNKNYSKTVIRV